jgi:hypothetical protein
MNCCIWRKVGGSNSSTSIRVQLSLGNSFKAARDGLCVRESVTKCVIPFSLRKFKFAMEPGHAKAASFPSTTHEKFHGASRVTGGS